MKQLMKIVCLTAIVASALLASRGMLYSPSKPSFGLSNIRTESSQIFSEQPKVETAWNNVSGVAMQVDTTNVGRAIAAIDNGTDDSGNGTDAERKETPRRPPKYVASDRVTMLNRIHGRVSE